MERPPLGLLVAIEDARSLGQAQWTCCSAVSVQRRVPWGILTPRPISTPLFVLPVRPWSCSSHWSVCRQLAQGRKEAPLTLIPCGLRQACSGFQVSFPGWAGGQRRGSPEASQRAGSRLSNPGAPALASPQWGWFWLCPISPPGSVHPHRMVAPPLCSADTPLPLPQFESGWGWSSDERGWGCCKL